MSDEATENSLETLANLPDTEWKHLAWRAWLRGNRNITQLAKQFEKNWHTVKKAIVDQAALVRQAIDSGDVDALAEYVDGLYEDLQEADQLFREVGNDNARLGALKHRTELREKLAAALNVITQRGELRLTGKDGDVLRFEHLTTGQLKEAADHNGDYTTASEGGASTEGTVSSADEDA